MTHLQPAENERGDDPAQARRSAVEVVRVLQCAGHRALFAGGCVRDEILGVHPTDYDVATDATPEMIGKLFRSTAHVGAHFGVVIVHTGGGQSVEVATFRRDGSYSDNRRPDSVEFADDVADANRRDFTVNALFLDPLASEDSPSIHGHVVDHVGGLADIEAKQIRAVGKAEDRLAEDHLRALRAVRFAARLGYTIHEDTKKAITEYAGDLAGVSAERVGQELRRMLAAPSRSIAVDMLTELGLEAAIFGQADTKPRLRLTALDNDATSFELALTAWILDRDGYGQDLKTYRRALCLSNDEQSEIAAIVSIASRLIDDWLTSPVAEQKRVCGKNNFSDAMVCVEASDPDIAAEIKERFRALAETPSGIQPKPLIDGEGLIEMGFAAGPAFGRVLKAVYDAQLEDQISDPEGARSLARKLLDSSEPSGPGGVE
jgi:tRNA nucleotidyltransferase/poly(A) polymerase